MLGFTLKHHAATTNLPHVTVSPSHGTAKGRHESIVAMCNRFQVTFCSKSRNLTANHIRSPMRQDACDSRQSHASIVDANVGPRGGIALNRSDARNRCLDFEPIRKDNTSNDKTDATPLGNCPREEERCERALLPPRLTATRSTISSHVLSTFMLRDTSKSHTHHPLNHPSGGMMSGPALWLVSPAAAGFVTERTHICLSMSACRNMQFIPSQSENTPQTQAEHEHLHAT